MTACVVRPALPEDALAAVEMLRDSITKLCVLDHHNEPATLERWLRNKTPEQFWQWLENPDIYVVIAEVDARIVGVAASHTSGEVRLCYVQPGLERTGIGRALLAALEAQARYWGSSELHLVSTATARPFYEHRGYVQSGESLPCFGLPGYPYVKNLTASSFPVQRRGATSDDLETLFQINKAALKSYVETTFGPWSDQFQRQLFFETTDLTTHELFLHANDAIGLCAVTRSPEAIDLNRLSILPAIKARASAPSHHRAETRGQGRKPPAAAPGFPSKPRAAAVSPLGLRDSPRNAYAPAHGVAGEVTAVAP
jgi:GNAT superfamily N-acetyltransferase